MFALTCGVGTHKIILVVNFFLFNEISKILNWMCFNVLFKLFLTIK